VLILRCLFLLCIELCNFACSDKRKKTLNMFYGTSRVLWDSHVLRSKNKSKLNSQTLNRKIRFVPGPYISQDSKLFWCHHEQQINQSHVKKHFPQKIHVKKMLLSSSVLHHLTFVKHNVFSYISLNLEIDIRENSFNTA